MKKLSEAIVELLAKRQKVSKSKVITKYGPALDVADEVWVLGGKKEFGQCAPNEFEQNVENTQDPVVNAENPKSSDSFTQPTTFETVAGRTGFVAMLQADLHYKSGLVQQKEKELDALLEAKHAEIRDLEAEVSMLRARVELTERTPIKGKILSGHDLAAAAMSDFMRWAGH